MTADRQTQRQQASAGPDQQQGAAATAATSASPSACPTTVTTAAWVPRLKQQQPQSQPAVPEERKAVPCGVHDLGSDLLVEQTDSASGSGGKGKNRSKSKKMNWKPLPVPIIRRDPHDRDRDIRGSTRKYGFNGTAGGAAGGKKQSPANMTNGFRNSGTGGTAGHQHHNNNNNLNHQVNQNAGTGVANNGHHHHHAHAVSPQTPVAAAQSTGDEGKVLRSGSVSSSSSYSRRHHHQHHQQASHHSDQTPGPTSPAAGGEVTNNHHSHNQAQQQSLSQQSHRLVNGTTTTSGTNRVSGRPPVLRSAAHSPPASPAHPHNRKQQHVDQYGGGRRQTAGIRASTGGSGRATPNGLKDFSAPEVQYFPMEYAALSHESGLMGNKTSGLMSPVLTLPPGAVVVPAPAFAGGPTAANSSTSLTHPFCPLFSLILDRDLMAHSLHLWLQLDPFSHIICV